MTHTQLRTLMVAAIFSGLFAVSCSDKGLNLDKKKTCTQGGKTVEVGQSVPGGDGCNTCVCLADGSLACTARDCAPDASADLPSNRGCVDRGKTYAIGESFRDDCNTCTCTTNGIACTLVRCPPAGGSSGALGGTGGNPGSGGAGGGTGGVSGSPGAGSTARGGSSGDSGGSTKASGGAGGGGASATGGTKPLGDAGVQRCIYGGKTYTVGQTFVDVCNTCRCTESGALACTAMLCNVDAAPAGPDGGGTCVLSANLTFGEDGGNALYWDVSHLTSSSLTITRNYTGRAGRDGSNTSTCSPALPACGAAGAVSVATINADLADPDVQGLWSLPQNPVPIFGVDDRPVDGTVFSIALDDGRKVLVGRQCASPSMSSCRYIPAGLVRLTADLRTMTSAGRSDPLCKGL